MPIAEAEARDGASPGLAMATRPGAGKVLEVGEEGLMIVVEAQAEASDAQVPVQETSAGVTRVASSVKAAIAKVR